MDTFKTIEIIRDYTFSHSKSMTPDELEAHKEAIRALVLAGKINKFYEAKINEAKDELKGKDK